MHHLLQIQEVGSASCVVILGGMTETTPESIPPSVFNERLHLIARDDKNGSWYPPNIFKIAM
jgi:hypothetical protein